jgi:lysophospholipase L1-like esterase
VLASAVCGVLLVVIGVTAAPTLRHEFRLWRSCLASHDIEDRVKPKRMALSRGDKPLLGVLGDSWAQGAELENPLEAFPYGVADLTEMRVLVDGKQGTGYLNDGPCKDEPFDERLAAMLAADPDILILAMGLNDAVLEDSNSAVEQAFQGVLKDRPSRVIVLAPFDPPTAPHTSVAELSNHVEAAAARAGFEFVSVNDDKLSFLPDGIHPDEAGRSLIAKELAAVIENEDS